MVTKCIPRMADERLVNRRSMKTEDCGRTRRRTAHLRKGHSVVEKRKGRTVKTKRTWPRIAKNGDNNNEKAGIK